MNPRSLSWQIAFVIVAALLVAGSIQFAMLLAERFRSAVVDASGPAITRFVDVVSEVVERGDSLENRTLRGRFGRLSVTDSPDPSLWGNRRNAFLERRLERMMTEAGVPVKSVRASVQLVDPRAFRHEPRPWPAPPTEDEVRRPAELADRDAPRLRLTALGAELENGRWVTGAFISPLPPDRPLGDVIVGAAITLVAVLAAALWFAARLSRPLRELSAAVEQVGGAAEPQPIAERGPAEIRTMIGSFNAMSARVSALLAEKDVMLGALGHDLRTPLASLRIRLESMEPEEERERAIKTVEETAALLESILSFARTGRSTEPEEIVELGGLCQSLAEEYADAGAAISCLVAEPISGRCRPLLLRRMLRNLIDNARAHGSKVTVSVKRLEDSEMAIDIDDDGPGMSPELLATAKQPFRTGSTSRNRSSGGGAGLGLALADAVARAHGGDLVLENLSPQGFRARVVLPSVSA